MPERKIESGGFDQLLDNFNINLPPWVDDVIKNGSRVYQDLAGKINGNVENPDPTTEDANKNGALGNYKPIPPTPSVIVPDVSNKVNPSNVSWLSGSVNIDNTNMPTWFLIAALAVVAFLIFKPNRKTLF